MSTVDITANEAAESLTGFDEIAIKRSFGQTAFSLRDDPMQFLRALIFVQERRGGKKDPEAFEAAQSLSITQANDYFADAEIELDPDSPETESGKDDSESGVKPTT